MSEKNTEFLVGVAQAIETPLTVISVNIQTAKGILERTEGPIKDTEAAQLLADAQKEIMNLACKLKEMLMEEGGKLR